MHINPFPNYTIFTTLPNDKILNTSKFKEFADNKKIVTQSLKFTFGREFEIYIWKSIKHCRKRRKCWLPAFSPFPTMFSEAFF